MAYGGSPDYERAGKIAYYLGVAGIAAALLFSAFRPHAPPPANEKAFGCYTNPSAPPILLDRTEMTILQSPALQVKYHIERGKTGIVLTVDAPIKADLIETRYLYSIASRGIGQFLPFFNERNGRSYGEFDENSLRQFTMGASDGTVLAYRKAPASACQL